MPTELPRQINMPDLSGLDSKLTENLVRARLAGRGFPDGKAHHLVTAFTRTTESALRRYEEARLQLLRSTVAATNMRRIAEFIRGQDDLEVTLMVLHRAMRVADRLRASPETKVSRRELPTQADRDLLRDVRNAVDHRDHPIVAGLAGTGRMLAILVRERDLTIDVDDDALTITHDDLADWIRALHTLAAALTNEPERWLRTSLSAS